MRWVVQLLTLILLLTPGATARAQVLDYHSDITVRGNGALEIVETILVDASSASSPIQRGIFRDFPTRYNRGGREAVVPFEVVSVLRDGSSERWHKVPQSNGFRLYVGDPDRTISRARHTYVLRYRTARHRA